MAATALWQHSASELPEGYARRQFSPVEVVDELYARQQKLSGSSVVGIDDAGPDLLERTGDQTAADPFEQTSRHEMTERLVAGSTRP